MIRKSIFLFTIVSLIAFGTIALCDETAQTQAATPASSPIVQHLTSKLGITADQAAGGAGAIFALAKQKLPASDFTKVAEAVPDIDTLIKAVPAATGGSGEMMKAATSAVGGAASLAAPFQKLGMSPDMVGKFIPEVVSYVRAKGGDSAGNGLANALK
jgi:hypothetical protein